MARTKISEFSSTPGNNTDIDGININEGCAPSGINDAIRELMSQLKDFQAGTAGDSFNGPVGTTTAAAGAFTTLSASSTVSGTGFSTYLASPPAIGATTPSSAKFTSITNTGLTSGRVTYAGASGLLQDSANLLYSGTDLTVYGLTVGRGAGAVSTNTAVGASALAANTTGAYNSAFGIQALTTNTTGERNTAIGRQAMYLNTTGGYNVAVGMNVLEQNTTASNNTAIGYAALQNTTTGSNNVAVGYSAGVNLTTSTPNVAVGAQALFTASTNGNNVAVGYSAGYSLTTGSGNNDCTFIGNRAGYGTTSGYYNVAIGTDSLYTNSTGIQNVAVGNFSMNANTTGYGNSALGFRSFQLNTTGIANTAIGQQALYSNTTASNNTAVGYQAAYNNTTGASLVAIGNGALYSNTTGSNNISIGGGSLQSNTTGGSNVAIGINALPFNTTASYNTAVGYQALYANTTGTENVAIGPGALSALTTGYENIAIGRGAGSGLTTPNRNTLIGDDCGYAITTGGSNTIIGRYTGNNGGLDIRTANGYIVLSDGDGNPRGFFDNTGSFLVNSTSAIRARTGQVQIQAASTQEALVTSSNDLTYSQWAARSADSGAGTHYLAYFEKSTGTAVGSITHDNTNTAYNTSSDYRLKDNAQPLTGSGAFIDSLKPKTWTWKESGDKGVGFIAHEVQEVSPGSVVGEKDAVDAEGNPKYQAMEYGSAEFIANIIAELQSLRKRVAELEAK